MKKAMLVVVACALLSFIQIDRSHAAAVDIFLFIPGVPGEVLHKDHANWIQVQSAAWGHGAGSGGGGGGAQRTVFENLTVSKLVDYSSSMLALAAADGRYFKNAILVFRKKGQSPVVFLEVNLTDVIVRAYGAGSGGDVPTESVKLGFAKIEWVYHKQNPDGKSQPVRTGWDLNKNIAK